MQESNPLGPTNYTGSYTSSKNMIVVIGAWCYQQQGERRCYQVVMLARTFSKVQSIPNSTNAQLVKEMYEHLKSNGVSERHQLDVHN